MRILVADDDRALAETLRRGLEENGHQVILAFDGTDALEIVQVQDFELLILDVMMPGIDGLNVVRRVRDTRNQTPIIMLTARDGMEDMARSLDQGATTTSLNRSLSAFSLPGFEQLRVAAPSGSL